MPPLSSSKALKPVSIFISSPGDAADARERIRKAVKRVNRLVGRPNDILLEAIGWEDIPAGKANRVQDLINPYVKKADIFIGVLNKRFGTPTGAAESGTEEEYNLISKRWQEENPPPEVKIYFKCLRKEDVSDPGPQLEHVLAFKKRISSTDLYGEFDSVENLGDTVEEALADWIYRMREDLSSNLLPEMRPITALGVKALAEIVKNGELTKDALTQKCEVNEQALTDAVAALERFGLIKSSTQGLRPNTATEVFFSIAKHLNSAEYYKVLLGSAYFKNMLSNLLISHVHSRFHFSPDQGVSEVLRKLSLLSPSVADYLLFGDTEFYDNLAEHGHKIGQLVMAQDFINRNLLHRTLLKYGEDSVKGRLLDTVDGIIIQGQVFRIRLSAAHLEGNVFAVDSVMPLMRFQAGEAIEKGQIVTGSPDSFVQVGTLLMHMGEDKIALKELERGLALDLPDEARFAALNNKGLILLRQQRLPEAIDVFEKAIAVDPKRPEPKANLKIARGALAKD